MTSAAGYRDPAITMDELSRWWLEQHGPLALGLVEPLPRAYEQLHADHDASAIAASAAGVPARGYDMYDTISVDSMEDLVGALMSPEGGPRCSRTSAAMWTTRAFAVPCNVSS